MLGNTPIGAIVTIRDSRTELKNGDQVQVFEHRDTTTIVEMLTERRRLALPHEIYVEINSNPLAKEFYALLYAPNRDSEHLQKIYGDTEAPEIAAIVKTDSHYAAEEIGRREVKKFRDYYFYSARHLDKDDIEYGQVVVIL